MGSAVLLIPLVSWLLLWSLWHWLWMICVSPCHSFCRQSKHNTTAVPAATQQPGICSLVYDACFSQRQWTVIIDKFVIEVISILNTKYYIQPPSFNAIAAPIPFPLNLTPQTESTSPPAHHPYQIHHHDHPYDQPVHSDIKQRPAILQIVLHCNSGSPKN